MINSAIGKTFRPTALAANHVASGRLPISRSFPTATNLPTRTFQIKTFLAALAVALSIGSAQAATLNFSFSFTDGTDTVAGIIHGLTDNATSAASDVTVTTAPFAWGLGSYMTCGSCYVFTNSFSVTAGEIASASFDALTSFAAPQAKLLLTYNEFENVGGLFSFSTETLYGAVIYGTGTVSPVPLPAGGVLLLSAIFGVAGFGHRRKPAARV